MPNAYSLSNGFTWLWNRHWDKNEFVAGFQWGLEQRLSITLPLPSCLCRALLALLPLLDLYPGNIVLRCRELPAVPGALGSMNKTHPQVQSFKKNLHTAVPWSACVLDRAACLTSLSTAFSETLNCFYLPWYKRVDIKRWTCLVFVLQIGN